MSGPAQGGGPASRLERLAVELGERSLDGLLVTNLVDLRYLTGFTGSHGLALISAEGGSGHRFLTDFRYATQSVEQVNDRLQREIVRDDLLEALAGGLPPRPRSGGSETAPAATGEPDGEDRGRLGFDERTLTVAQHERLRELLGSGWELVPCSGAVQQLRAVKDAAEIARIRAASRLADDALASVLEAGLVGRTELEVAIELELRMRRLGAQAPSFPSIVAAGEHAALPHAEPRAVEIPKDVLITIDWGALLDGYCSDCTRTYATGESIGEEAREVYELVLAAQEQALAAVRAGPSGRELDAVARDVIAAGGQGERFGHGLGHGVGMEVHEGPRLSRTAGDEPLRAGNVVTIEPGVYLPGRLGVRIEDLAVVGEGDREVLTGLPKQLTVIG
jgi:Xaa-Pro aminopeptidase